MLKIQYDQLDTSFLVTTNGQEVSVNLEHYHIPYQLLLKKQSHQLMVVTNTEEERNLIQHQIPFHTLMIEIKEEKKSRFSRKTINPAPYQTVIRRIAELLNVTHDHIYYYGPYSNVLSDGQTISATSNGSELIINDPKKQLTPLTGVMNLLKSEEESPLDVPLIKKETIMSLLDYSRHTTPTAEAAMKNEIIPFPGFDPIPFNDELWIVDKGTNTTSYQLYIHSLRVASELMNEYKKTETIDYLLKAQEVVDSWIDFAQHDETKMTWYDHPTANRMQVMLELMYLLQEAHLTERLSVYMQQLDKHSQFLMDDTKYRPNNHGLMMDRTLMVAGNVLSNPLYFLKGKSRAQQTFWINYSSQGTHLENSPEYHHMVTKMYHSIEDYLNLNHESLGKEISDRLTLADKYLASIATFSKRVPAIGDSSEITVKATTKRNFHDADAGITVIKDEPLYLAFICGFTTATHKHPDDLSLILSYNGRDFFKDTGKFNYSKGAERTFVLSQTSHSSYQLTETYDRQPDNRLTKRIWTDHYFDCEDYTIISGYHHGYNHAKLRRTVYYLKEWQQLFIIDNGTADTSIDWLNRLQLSDAVRCEAVRPNHIKLTNTDTTIEVLTLTEQIISIIDTTVVPGIEQPFISERAGKKKATRQLLMTDTGDSNQMITQIKLETTKQVDMKLTGDHIIFTADRSIELPLIR